MAVTRLSLYNNALYILGERRLVTEFEDREPRYVLDQIADLNAYEVVLELVKPKFAVSSVKLGSPVASTVHGVDSVYTFPADYISTLGEEGLHGANASFFSDENFQNPIDRYILEGRTVACDVQTNIWMRYITRNSDLSAWTPMFGKLVATYLAKESASRINPNRIDYAEQQFAQALAISIQYESVKENPIVPQAPAADLSTEELQVYNLVTHELGAPEFRGVADGSVLRLAIDSVYALTKDAVLAAVKPKFATVVVALSSSATSDVHGFDNVFTLPAAFRDIVSLWADDKLAQPVTRYFIEGDKLAVDGVATVYLRYITNASTASEFSPLFREALAARIAMRLCARFAPELMNAIVASAQAKEALAFSVESFKEMPARPLPTTTTLTDAYRSLYNKALEILELAPLISNTDNSDRRVKLDYAMNNKAVETVFELISWGFLYKKVKIDKTDALDEAWGPKYGFNVPADMIRIDAMSSDEYFRHPLEYSRIGNVFNADVTTIYLRYLSNDDLSDPTTWPVYIYNLVAAQLAESCLSLDGANRNNSAIKYSTYKDEAYNTDAQRNPPQIITTGSWVGSRASGATRRNERP